MRVQEGISPEIAARRVSERRGEERDDRRGRVAVRQERERANGCVGACCRAGPGPAGDARAVSARGGGAVKRRWRVGLGAEAGWEREGERERAGGGPGAWAAQRSAERVLVQGDW